jgi:1-deoxy-D-xylulose 5-phosphate reductoisomerase
MQILQKLVEQQQAKEDQLLAEAVESLFGDQADIKLSEPQDAEAVIAGILGVH